MVYEWNLLRVIACLSVVLLHATTITENLNGYIDQPTYQFLRVFLCFATPSFILLAIIILANRYQTELPNNFLISRFKFIYIPFFCMCLIYAFNDAFYNGYATFFETFYRNVIFGEFSGWFVLTIMQLYIIFLLLKRYKPSIVWFLPIMFVLGILYLTYINMGSEFVMEHNEFFRMLFLAWLPYFSIAYFLGTYYEQITRYLVKYKYVTVLFAIICGLIVYTNFSFGADLINSRRTDMIFLVFSMTLLILAFGKILPKLKFVQFMSRYSFGIFLIHWLVQEHLAPYTSQLSTTFFQVISLFLVSLVTSILVIKIISLLPYSKYIIGKAHIRKNV